MDNFEKRVNSSKNRNTRIVRVKKSRVCCKCGAVIFADSKCLTTNSKGTGRRWLCMTCLDKELKGHIGVNFNCNVYKELSSVCVRMEQIPYEDEGGYLALRDYYDELVSECATCGKCGLSEVVIR